MGEGGCSVIGGNSILFGNNYAGELFFNKILTSPLYIFFFFLLFPFSFCFAFFFFVSTYIRNFLIYFATKEIKKDVSKITHKGRLRIDSSMFQKVAFLSFLFYRVQRIVIYIYMFVYVYMYVVSVFEDRVNGFPFYRGIH